MVSMQTEVVAELRRPLQILDQIAKLESDEAFLDKKIIQFLEQKLILAR